MGVFTIIHKEKKNPISKEKVLEVYDKKKLDRVFTLETEKYSFLVGKSELKCNDLYQTDKEIIFCFGTFIYKGKIGSSALKIFFGDHFANEIDKNQIFGAFQILLIDKSKGDFKLIADENDSFDLFRNIDEMNYYQMLVCIILIQYQLVHNSCLKSIDHDAS